MHEVRIDRLCIEPAVPILHGMKKAPYTLPTLEELYALEKRARAERARHVAALLRSACERVVAMLSSKVARHA